MSAEEALRQRIIKELREQGFDILPQLQLPFPGVWFHGKFFNLNDLDTSRWGRSNQPTKGVKE